MAPTATQIGTLTLSLSVTDRTIGPTLARCVSLVYVKPPYINPSTPPTPVGSQNDLGVLGGDVAGFPNGRRPIDDVVDIELRVAMGVLLSPFDGSAKDPDPSSDASRQLHYTDGVEPSPASYLAVFPYVNTPLAGSPTRANA